MALNQPPVQQIAPAAPPPGPYDTGDFLQIPPALPGLQGALQLSIHDLRQPQGAPDLHIIWSSAAPLLYVLLPFLAGWGTPDQATTPDGKAT